MSVARIAGVVDPARPTAALTAEARRLAGYLHVPVDSTARVVADAGAAFVWRGPGLAEVHNDARWMVVLDGSIYNRADLDRSAPSTAAAVASGIEQWGIDEAIQRLNGDFAFAAFDKRERMLHLVRDRCGVRPLYHATGDGISFASTPGPLLGGQRCRPNRRYLARVAASHYRIFDNDPAESPYEGVEQVPAAHALRSGAAGSTLRRYWCGPGEYDDADQPGEAHLAAQYREMLLDAVGVRLGAEQAFTLSGGMDSSSVLSAAVHLSGDKQHAWSTVYDDRTYDESEDIRTILDATVSAWHQVPIEPDDVLGRIAAMIELHEEPVATATWLAHDVLSGEAAAAGVRCMFGGLGGDELNAGEYEYFPYHFADLRASGAATLDAEIAAWVHHHDHPIHRKSPEAALALMDRLTGPGGACRADPDRLRRYAALLEPGWLEGDVLEPELEHPFSTCLRNRTWQDLVSETLPCCLRAQDRQGVPRGIEHRLPFLDHRLVEFMYAVPGTMKIRDGVTKILLRRAMAGIVPEPTRMRIAKTGWNAPAHRWFTGAGAESLLDLVRSRSFAERGLYRPDACEALIREHESIVASGAARENHMMVLWQMANVELWLRWLEARPESDAQHGDGRPQRAGARH